LVALHAGKDVADEARLALLILAVEDLNRAVGFYRAAFGWFQAVDDALYADFALPGDQRLGLYARSGFERNIGQAPVPCRAATSPARRSPAMPTISPPLCVWKELGLGRSVHERSELGARRLRTSPTRMATSWC
jgi:hypothetical protein